jgi:transposase
MILQPDGKVESETRSFGTMTDDLLQLHHWLGEHQVTDIAMESTGVYWKPIWNLLEGDFSLTLCNARHIKHVPGRKTDVKDAEWIAHLHLCGLLAGSLVPDRPRRELRDLTRHHVQLTGERTRAVNRIQKILEDTNVKLASVATDIMGVSGRAMLSALIAGQTDARNMAELAKGRMRGKIPDLRRALQGHLTDHHRFMLQELMTHVEFLEGQLVRICSRIDQTLHTLDHQPTTLPSPAAPDDEAASPDRDEGPVPTLATLPRDANGHLLTPLTYHQSIALLDEVPGFAPLSLRLLLAETGTDMRPFPDAEHFTSWSKICPGLDQSGGKRKNASTGKGNRWLRAILGEMAWAAARTRETYFRSQFASLMRRRGKKRAVIAVAHSLLTVTYHMLATGQRYKELGVHWLDLRDPERVKKQCVMRLRDIGYRATLEPIEPATA